MKQLSDLELDALKEMLNIGVGYAADSFSRLIDQPVKLLIPEFKMIYGESASSELRSLHPGSGSMVRQNFRGAFTADGVFLFPGEGSLELVRLMVGKRLTITEMKELEQDALVEVGNILFNTCVSVISDMINSPFECDMPSYESGNLGSILAGFDRDEDCLLLMKIEFIVENVQIQGFIMFLMKMESLDTFILAINKYLGLPS